MWLVTFLSFFIMLVHLGSMASIPCPCHNPAECQLIEMPLLSQNHTIGYVLKSDPASWKSFHWPKLTIVSMWGFHHDELMCQAHRHKARIVQVANFTVEDIKTQAKMDAWAENWVSLAKSRHHDGIELLIEDEIAVNDSVARANLTRFVSTVTKVFHEKIPGSVVLFNAPFSPYNEQKLGVDGRNYDYKAISDLVDLVSIRAFDQRSQTYTEPCLAGPPENHYITMGGLLAYQKIGVDLGKLLLTLGYYVDEYICLSYGQNFKCTIPEYNYRGSKCSSRAVARQIPWNEYEQMSGQCWRKVWHEHSYHYVYTFLDNTWYGQVHQYWSDYPGVWKKIALIDEFGLRGIGAWTLDYLDENSWKQLPSRQ